MSPAESFMKDDIQKLLFNKFIVVIGDSVQRSVYKDLVMLLQHNSYLAERHLRKKGELQFCDDRLVEGGQLGEMTNLTSYREVREYQTDTHLVRFYFVTRCYGDYMESILSDFKEDPQPDIIIMNSCLWDITRYGPKSVQTYKINLNKAMDRFQDILPSESMVIWSTALPVANTIRGGFLLPEIEYMTETLRLDIVEANNMASEIVFDHGYDVLDMHYYFRNDINDRAGDGVHWNMTAHRRMTNLHLTHIAQAWGVNISCLSKPSKSIPRNLVHNPNLVGRSSTLQEMPICELRGNRNSYNRRPNNAFGMNNNRGPNNGPVNNNSNMDMRVGRSNRPAFMAQVGNNQFKQGVFWPGPDFCVSVTPVGPPFNPPSNNPAYQWQEFGQNAPSAGPMHGIDAPNARPPPYPSRDQINENQKDSTQVRLRIKKFMPDNNSFNFAYY